MTIIIILIITSCADRILRLRDYNKRTIILPIVIVTSIILAILSYNYFSQTAIQIQELAIDDLQSNAETEAYSISNSLTNAISAITSNLEIIANAPSTMEENISKIQTLLNVGKNTARNLTDGYYFLNSDGRLEAFTGIEKEENAKFKGIDLSYRSYFQIPKQNEILYISNVINSNDNISRMYISFPILQNKQTYSLETTESTVRDSTDGLQPNVNSNSTVFNGAIVASIEAKTLGNFLQGQIHPSFNGDIAFLDRNGTLLYTQNQSFIGQNYFGNEFQSYLKAILGDKAIEFNSIIDRAFNTERGLDEFDFENTSTTIAYEAVYSPEINNDHENNRIGTLFVTIPHTLAGNVATLIDNQQMTNYFTIGLIAGIATVILIMLLKWNNTLQQVVNQRTFQLKETVSKLTKANEDLTLHDKLQKEFINIAAHELRTPTQAISGNLELIEMIHLPSLFEQTEVGEQDGATGGTDEEFENLVRDKTRLKDFKACLLSTYRNSQRLESLVNNILDVSRIESKKLQLNKEYFNLNEKIRNVIKDIGSKQHIDSLSNNNNNNNRNLSIEFEPSEDPITVYADKIRMFEVLSNLLTNAVKFSNGRPITISVKRMKINAIDTKHKLGSNSGVSRDNISENNDGMHVVVSIRDRGTGIDPDILPRLFTKFATKSNQGTGLGLYIAKNIIEAHGGQIWAQNNYDNDKGAIFSFSLPLSE